MGQHEDWLCAPTRRPLAEAMSSQQQIRQVVAADGRGETPQRSGRVPERPERQGGAVEHNVSQHILVDQHGVLHKHVNFF